jgi:hypothetical protein
MQRNINHDVGRVLALWQRTSSEEQFLRFLSRDGQIVFKASVKRSIQKEEQGILEQGRLLYFSVSRLSPKIEDWPEFSVQGPLVEETSILAQFLEKLKNEIATIDKCRHCSTAYYNPSCYDACTACSVLLASFLLTDACVICRTNDHPIEFVCRTCKDSQICSLCYTQVRKHGGKYCQICARKPQRMRRYHGRFDSDSSDSE